jgi:hypothetical protein
LVGIRAGSIRRSAAIAALIGRVALTSTVCVGVFSLVSDRFPSSGIVYSGQLHPYREAAPVCIRLTMVDHVSGHAQNSFVAEATRIWIRHGIDLTWKQPVPATCPTIVSMVFDERELLKLAGGVRDTALARTVFLGRSQTIYVSVPRAFAMLSQLNQHNKTISSGGERDVRGGTLIGRVVAHELGHVLLTTTAHSEKGLMRPVFGLRDVLSAEQEATALSPIETNRLAMRFSLVPFDGPSRTSPSELARTEPSK